MIEELKHSTPVARKEYRCMFCGCIIPKGERYHRATNKYDGDIYDFVTHEDCEVVAHRLDMFSTDYDGVDECQFQEHIDEYLQDNYYDESIDDIQPDVDRLSRVEQVRLILADWDAPRIKIKRLKEQIRDAKHQLSLGRIHSPVYIKLKEEYVCKLEAELKELEGQL